MAKLTLYTNPTSRGQIAHWMMEELGEPYETVWLPYGPAGTKSEAYRALNPMGKMPTLVHGDAVVTECAAICTYLADTFPARRLGPEDGERADYYRWTLFAAGPVEQAVIARAMGWQTPAGKERTVGFGTYDETVNALAGHFATRAYVCGDRFTAADVYVGSQVMWGIGFGTLPKLAPLVAYAERLGSREAQVRCKALNDAQRAEMNPGR